MSRSVQSTLPLFHVVAALVALFAFAVHSPAQGQSIAFEQAVAEAASDSASSNSYLKTKLYLSKTSLNEVAFIALLGVTILVLIGYRRRNIRRRAEGRTYEPITGKVPYAPQGP